MSTRDEIEEAITAFGKAEYALAETPLMSPRLTEAAIRVKDARERLMALIAAIAPAPRPDEVRITDEMLDRGTNAIYLRMHQYPTAMEKWNELTDGVRDGYRDYARVVLEAALQKETK